MESYCILEKYDNGIIFSKFSTQLHKFLILNIFVIMSNWQIANLALDYLELQFQIFFLLFQNALNLEQG